MRQSDIEQSMFGTTGQTVTRVGLGGEGVLRTHGHYEQARAVVERALARGITYFDTAPAYAGSEAYLGSIWKNVPERRTAIFHTSKSAQRSYSGAMRDLERTLATLHTDYLDLWQIHDVRDMDEVTTIGSADGALRAFLEARESGVVRHIGVTGHHDPDVLTKCVQLWPLDSVLLPVNPVEAVLGGFLTETLPAARNKSMAVVAMKVLGGGHYLASEQGLTAQALLRFALAQAVDVVIVGCSSPDEVDLLVQTAGMTPAMEETEQARLVDIFRPYAGRLAFYRGKK
ncbi:MAG: aldo/keto reductase [Desulfovibrionales bacterium]|nr:MAG: aldo/keto reductase [Desulfovibrionales bacterium]